MTKLNRITRFFVVAALTGGSAPAFASGFQLIEQNASGLGNAYAGQAASAEDASTIYFNPAGMTRLRGQQLVATGNLINPSAKFSNGASTTATPPFGAQGPQTGGNGGDAGGWAFVPNFYYSAEVAPNWRVGLGVNAPFGLKTEYNPNWVGRYQAVRSELTSIDINPSVAVRVNDMVSLGFGLSYQYLNAELTKAIDFGTICQVAISVAACTGLGLPAQAADGSAKVTGSDWAWGFNLGAMFNIGQDSRIGVSYRSGIKHTLTGDAVFSKPAALPAPIAGSASVTNGAASASVSLPDTFSLAFVTKLSPKWTIQEDYTWTHWSQFQELRIRFGNGAPDSVRVENWRNTFRVGIGATYQATDAWKLRLGFAYDQSPVRDEFRTARIPDQDRNWVALGAQFNVSKGGVIDLGYAHLFVRNATINSTEPVSASLPSTLTTTLNGNYSNEVDIVSIQYKHSF